MSWCTALNIICSSLRGHDVLVHGSSPLRGRNVMVPGSQYNMLVTQRTSSHGARQLFLNMLVTQRTSSHGAQQLFLNMLVTQRTSSHGAQQLSLNMLVTQRTSSHGARLSVYARHSEDVKSWCTALNICSSLRGRNVMVHGSQ
ncbi:hypothetical protein E4U46_001119 [Claviceps purpurea]|nr:hypothetical protein E4U46_001119 [Claviceps purpurea]